LILNADLLIWVFRGNPKAAQEIDRAEERMISVVTVMELYQGLVRAKKSAPSTSSCSARDSWCFLSRNRSEMPRPA